MAQNGGRRSEERNVYIYLANNGPTPYVELPKKVGPGDRECGVRKLVVTTNAQGSTQSGGGRTNGVYYIEGKHEVNSVTRAWVDANQSTVEAVSGWSLLQRCPEPFRTALKEEIEYDNPGNGDGNNGSTDMDCPFCGEGGIKSIPDHLPSCEERQ